MRHTACAYSLHYKRRVLIALFFLIPHLLPKSKSNILIFHKCNRQCYLVEYAVNRCNYHPSATFSTIVRALDINVFSLAAALFVIHDTLKGYMMFICVLPSKESLRGNEIAYCPQLSENPLKLHKLLCRFFKMRILKIILMNLPSHPFRVIHFGICEYLLTVINPFNTMNESYILIKGTELFFVV